MSESCAHDLDASRIDAAFALFRRLRSESPGIPSHRLALQAIDTVYCTMLDLTSESVSCRLTPLRENQLAKTVLDRAGLGGWEPASSPARDRVEQASVDSFPSSDPPAWIWGRPDGRDHDPRPRVEPMISGARRRRR